jgi:hypothetical protein
MVAGHNLPVETQAMGPEYYELKPMRDGDNTGDTEDAEYQEVHLDGNPHHHPRRVVEVRRLTHSSIQPRRPD